MPTCVDSVPTADGLERKARWKRRKLAHSAGPKDLYQQLPWVSSSKMADALLHLQVPNGIALSQQQSRKAPLSLLSDEWPD